MTFSPKKTTSNPLGTLPADLAALGWDDVLAVTPTSGANSPVINTGQTLTITDFTVADQFVRHNGSGVLTSFDLFDTANTWDGIQSHSKDINMLTANDINLATGSVEFLAKTFGIFGAEENGDVWRFRVNNTPTAEVIFDNVGFGDFSNFKIGADQVTIGTGQLGSDYSLKFDGASSDGILNYNHVNARFEFDQNLRINTLGLGLLHSDATGIITSSTVDMASGADTNIAVTAPVLLTGSTLSLDLTASYNWTTGTHTFNTDTVFNNNLILESGDTMQNLTSGEILLQAESGQTNDHNIEFDLDLSNSAFQINSDATVMRFNVSPAILDNVQMQYGNGAVSRSGWIVDTTERFFHGVSTTTSGNGSGIWMLVENNDQSSVNRRPAGNADPIFYVFSSDQTSAGDFIAIEHNQTDGVIHWGDGDLDFELDGTAVIMRLGSSNVNITTALEVDGAFNHDGSTFGVFGTTPAVQSAAYSVTNLTTDRAYDADAVLLPELADIVGTMIADLRLLGILG